MDRPIPGFYYDQEKKRYFKITGSGHAGSASAAYNADNVKKRKIEEQKAERARKRQEKTKDLIKRASVLRNPITGGRLVREFGVVDRELPVESWTAGLRDKGGISFDMRRNDRHIIKHMIVNGDDTRSGMGVVYANSPDNSIAGSYIPTDEKGRINFTNDPQMRHERLGHIYRMPIFRVEEITAMNYHKPSETVVFTDQHFDPTPNPLMTSNYDSVLIAFSPTPSDGTETDQEDMDVDRHGTSPPHSANRPSGGEPRWLLGALDMYTSINITDRADEVHNMRTAPASHPGATMLIASNRGLLELCLKPDRVSDLSELHNLHSRYRNPEFLSADYHPSNTNIVFAGRRDGKFLRVDRRVPRHIVEGEHGAWETPSFGVRRREYQGPSSVAHLRALDDHQLLIAGPRSAMAIYDVRWMKTCAETGKHPQQQSQGPTTPVVRMHEYQNMPHIKFGLDVSMGLGGTGGGVVAVGQDNGTLGLFSVRTGQKLQAGDVDEIKLSPNQGEIIHAVQFETMPWHTEPSLFVGVGSVIKMYGFGTGHGDDDY